MRNTTISDWVSHCVEREKKEVKGLFALQKFTFFALEIDM